MKARRFSLLLASLTGLAITPSARSQGYPVIDLQSIIQLGALTNVANSQLGALGNILQIGTQSLQQAQQINTVLGQPNGINSLLKNSSVYDLQGMLRRIPGMEGVDANSLFPPNVMGAFLGKTLGQWQQMITNPSTLFAQELKRGAVGGLVISGGSSKPEEAAFMNYMTNGAPKDHSHNALQAATTFSRLLTARLLESQQQQAQQQAAYATKKQELDQAAQGSLTVLDRQKLTNDQKSLELEIQLNAIQAQTLSNTDQAIKMDAQTQIMEQQAMRDDMDRATRQRP